MLDKINNLSEVTYIISTHIVNLFAQDITTTVILIAKSTLVLTGKNPI